VVAGHSRSQPVRSGRKYLLFPGYSLLYRLTPYRPVTPEVAGSSPVAPVYIRQITCKSACYVARRGANEGWPSHPAYVLRETSPAIPAPSRVHPAIPANWMTGQHGRRSAADRARRSLTCRDFVTADNGSSPHPARIPRAVLCSTNARPSPGSRTASRDAHEPIRSRRTFRAAVSAPERRARLLPVLTACGESRLRSRARRGPRRSRDDRLRPTRPWPRAWPRP
jgi:hypothetical protein